MKRGIEITLKGGKENHSSPYVCINKIQKMKTILLNNPTKSASKKSWLKFTKVQKVTLLLLQCP